MASLIIAFIFLFLTILGGALYYYNFTKDLKEKNRLLGENIDEVAVKLKEQGVDRHYASLSTEEVLKEHKRKIHIRLDHLIINRFEEIITPRLPYYLEVNNDAIILDFLEAKTGKKVEYIEQYAPSYY